MPLVLEVGALSNLSSGHIQRFYRRNPVKTLGRLIEKGGRETVTARGNEKRRLDCSLVAEQDTLMARESRIHDQAVL